MSPKAVFMDLDNTLLNSKKQVSTEDRAALTKAASLGHYMILCSGRPLATILPLVRDLGLEESGGYFICYNGALIFDCAAKKAVYQKPMDLSDVRAIFGESDRLGIHCQTYDSTGLLTRSMDRETEYYISVTGVTQRSIPTLPDNIPEPPYKVLCIDFDSHENLERLRKNVYARIPGKVNGFFSCNEFMEFVAAGVDKGTGIKRLCEILNVPMENTIGIGDSENDLPMLNVTHLSCCMANGTDACKAASDYITKNDCDHSGVAEVIQKFVL